MSIFLNLTLIGMVALRAFADDTLTFEAGKEVPFLYNVSFFLPWYMPGGIFFLWLYSNPAYQFTNFPPFWEIVAVNRRVSSTLMYDTTINVFKSTHEGQAREHSSGPRSIRIKPSQRYTYNPPEVT